MRTAVQRYSPLQFGFTVAELDPENEGALITRTYNCYTLPSPTKSERQNMSISTSTAVFLGENHFSFDKFFREGMFFCVLFLFASFELMLKRSGLSYLRHFEEAELRASKKEKELRDRVPVVLNRSSDSKVVDSVMYAPLSISLLRFSFASTQDTGKKSQNGLLQIRRSPFSPRR